MPTDRELLIALGAELELPRPALCRLAGRLDLIRDLLRSTRRSLSRQAAACGVPTGVLAAARKLLARAPAIARREEASARALDARIVTAADPEFPAPLRDLDLPPPSLYVRGTLPPPDLPPTLRSGTGGGDRAAVAVVGSRRADAYGREASELFGRSLASAGLTVVSGFARGVDAAAHRGALDGAAEGDGARECVTVAVLGTGLGVDYPRGHRRLGDAIAARGAVISEFPCGLPPKAWQFPVRNRVIAALAGATLVVRAARRSGSLVTARFALDLGRDVLAVPGRIFEERSRGTNALIADGAYPALSPSQVLSILGVATSSHDSGVGTAPDGAPPPAARDRSAADRDETAKDATRPVGGGPRGLQGRLLAVMAPAEPESPEALAERVEVSVDRVLGALLELELSGHVRREPGPAYVRRPEMA